jgi:putative transposase
MLEEFSEKRDKRYPHVSASWKSNWSEMATFFKFPPEVRSLIYIANPIESLHRKIKEVAKNRAIFLHGQVLIKPLFLAVEEASKQWTFRHRDWAMICSQQMIFFGDRLGEYT